MSGEGHLSRDKGGRHVSFCRQSILGRRHSECTCPEPGMVTKSIQPPNPVHSILASFFILLLALISI